MGGGGEASDFMHSRALQHLDRPVERRGHRRHVRHPAVLRRGRVELRLVALRELCRLAHVRQARHEVGERVGDELRLACSLRDILKHARLRLTYRMSARIMHGWGR